MGNNSDGLIAETPVPGIGGSATSGGITLAEEGTVALLAAATTSVPDLENDSAPLAEAFAVNPTRPPIGAEVLTGTETSSS